MHNPSYYVPFWYRLTGVGMGQWGWCDRGVVLLMAKIQRYHDYAMGGYGLGFRA